MNNVFKLITCLAFIACTQKERPVYISNVPPAVNAKTWLALGDSYTIGQSVSIAERFPHQTANILKTNGINIGEPDYIATTGWTCNNLSAAISQQNPAVHDVVSLLIGVNDEYQLHDTSNYRGRFTALLQKSIQLAGGKPSHVFVLSIPDYSVTPFASASDTARIRREIDWFNDINKSVTQSYNCPYLYITNFTREALNNPSLVANDGLHPSGAEYRVWANALAPLMLPELR